MRTLFFTILVCLSACLLCHADEKYKGERKSLQFKQELEQLATLDTEEIKDLISIARYNKTIKDKDETFYVTNNTDFRLSRLILQFSYYTLKDEMLTEKEYVLECDIPSKATRQLAVKSFDVHHNHYYHKSRRPKRDAIPYKVVYTLKRVDIALSIND